LGNRRSAAFWKQQNSAIVNFAVGIFPDQTLSRTRHFQPISPAQCEEATVERAERHVELLGQLLTDPEVESIRLAAIQTLVLKIVRYGDAEGT